MNAKTAKWWLKNLIGNNYYGFKWITKRFAKRQSIIVNEYTDIMIEGFPRSGNTFAVAAFNFAQTIEFQIARHRHEAGHVMLAVELKKPVILIIREPMSAVVSLCIREEIDIDFAFKYYVDFYRKLTPLKSHIAVIDFYDVVIDMGGVIQKINTIFGTDFKLFKHNYKNVERVKSIVENMDRLEVDLYETHKNKGVNRSLSVAFPTESRNKIKMDMIEKIKKDMKYTILLNKAEQVYRMFLNDKL